MSAVREAVALLGGISRWVRPGQKVLLKVNLLTAATPEKGITTHPAVTLALAELVREAGGRPVVADSPGPIPYTRAGLKKVYQAAGLLELERRGRLELNWDTTVIELPHSPGKIIKRFEVMRPVVESDIIIGVPKLKSHVFTTLTGATKIMFGVIPGLVKASFHARLQHVEEFGDMLLDLIEAVKPAFFVLDGILALEGDGPGFHGQPRPAGLVLAGADPVALDVVACHLIGLDPLDVPMLRQAARRGWWDGNRESVATVGEDPAKLVIADFRRPARSMPAGRGLDRVDRWQRLWVPMVKTLFSLRPRPDRRRCTGCATCVRSCPRQAITLTGSVAVINDRDCIRCYCCHEMCPEAAIDLRYGAWGQLAGRFGLSGSR